MVFWTIKSTEIIQKGPIRSPTGRSMERMIDPEEIRSFLRLYFGNPPKTPVLDLVFDPEDHVLFVRDQTDQIAGTIRYHFMGYYHEKPIYVVDAFCIHPQWRKKGVGDYLLTELNRYANERQIPYALFLKEGAPLSILHQPIYTGWYRYRELTENRSNHKLIDLSVQEAFRIMDIYRTFQPNVVVIRNERSIWKWFRSDQKSILIGIQDTHQRVGSKKLGWITAWIESPLITDHLRGEAADAVADSLYHTFDFLWSNERWIGNSMRWKRDGAFHFYTYQWSTDVPIGVSYAMMM
jgi:GNAT superfamily N-acetyltransferase